MLLSAVALAGCKRENPAPPPSPPPAAPSRAPTGPTGWLEGRVTVRGELPPRKPHRLAVSLEKQCGTEAPDLSLRVSADRALEDAVVSIDDAAVAPLPGGFVPAFLDQLRCVYTPPIVATRAGTSLKVKNSDPLIHNVRAMRGDEAHFNVAMPIENQVIDKKLPPSAGLLELKCDVHPWMRAWVVSFEHDQYALSGADGRFRVAGIPPGKHPVTLWHPILGTKQAEVEVAVDAGTTLELEWDISPPR